MDLTDIELVAMAAAAQNEKAFSVLVRRHQARLRAFLYRLCGDGAVADDIAQDTFLKAHRALATFKGGGSFRSWLFSIAYREFLQAKRKEKAALRLEDALKSQSQSEPDRDESKSVGLSLDIRRALQVLEPNERAALLLCDAAGLSHSEASIAIDAPLGSVKTYVARARKKMREALTKNPPSHATTAKADVSINDDTAAQTPKAPVKGALYAI